MIGLLLVLIAPVAAQDAPTPEPVGLRLDAPTYARHGSYWVGTQDVVIEPDSERPLVATIWYPALNPEGKPEAVAYQVDYTPTMPVPLPIMGHALLDAVPDAERGPYPLVIFSHGAWLSRLGSPYYTEHLASYGFVVIAVDHPGNTMANGGQSQSAYSILRPQDILRVIAYADGLTQSEGAMKGLINAEQIAVTGHSFGGFTALAAAGAQMNLKAYETWCAENPENDPKGLGLCTSFTDYQDKLAALAGLDTVPEGLWPPIADPRVKAVIGLAPGTTAAFGADGLAAIDIPVMLIAGSGDHTAPPEYHAYLGYQWLQTDEKALVTFEGADHSLFLDDCDALPWLLPDGFNVCADAVWDMNRAHDLINHFTTAFLLDVLKGDIEAHAALAPNNVSFPGIEYQAQGF